MSLIVKEVSESKFDIIPEGSYPAICYGVIDEGRQYNERFNKLSSKIRILWEINELIVSVDGKEVPRVISRSYTSSLNEKSNLRRDLVSWRGRQFNTDELLGFNMSNLVGKPCLLQIIHNSNAKSSEKFAMVSSVMRLPKEIPAPKQINNSVLFSFEDSDALDKLEKLPQWLQEIIKKSENYSELINGGAESVEQQIL